MTRTLALLAVLAAVVGSSAATASAPVPHIASIALDGSDVRVLSGAEPATTPRVARDGRILHYRGPHAPYALWVMNEDGTDARPLGGLVAGDGYGPITWSPNGASFATTGWDPSPCSYDSRNCAIAEIHVHDGRTGELRSRLRSRYRGAYEYAWSPDGRRIAALGELDQDLNAYAVEVANANGTGRRVLVRSRYPKWFQEVAWSPRGDRIAYVQRGWIWLVRPAGGKPVRVIRGRGLLWSPRGHLLYSVAGKRFLLDPATKRSRLLFHGPGEAVWSPDGKLLAYREGLAEGVTWLSLLRASDGRSLRTLKIPGDVTTFGFAPGGTRLVYGVRFD